MRNHRTRPNRPRLLIVTLAVAITLASPLSAAILRTRPARSVGDEPGGMLGAGSLADSRASLRATVETPPSTSFSSQPASAGSVDGYRWTNASYAVGPVAPGYRSGTQMAWDAADGYLLLFGGASAQGVGEADTWTYLNGTWTNITSSVIGTPPPTSRAQMAYDPSTDSVIMFGGDHVGVGNENYTWSYHGRTWTNITSTAGAPPATPYVSMASDSADGEVVLVLESSTDQTWTLKGGHWTNVTASAPPPLQESSSLLPFELGPDPSDGGVLLLSEFINANGYHGTTDVFRAGSWQNLTSEAPNAPLLPYGIYPWSVAPISYLPSAAAVVLYETLTMNQTGALFTLPESWFYSSGQWTNDSGPAGGGPNPWIGNGAAGAVDPTDSALVVFGGADELAGTPFWIPTWVLSAPPVVTATASSSSTDVGFTVHFQGNVTFGLEPNNAMWTFGNGSVSINLTAPHAYAFAGLYRANLTVTDLVGQAGEGVAPIVVNPRPLPSIAFAPAQPVAGGNVTFIAIVAGGTPPLTLAWTLGDGTTRSGATVTHSYAVPGNYTVNLTVTDAVGAVVSSTFTIEVASAQATVPPPSSSSGIDLGSGLGLALLTLVVLLAALVVVLGVLLSRRRGKPRSPPDEHPPPATGGSVAPSPSEKGNS